LNVYLGLAQKKTSMSAANRVITTEKFLRSDIEGFLPANLERLLSGFSSAAYSRVGVCDTKSSFLECVIYGSNELADWLKMPVPERVEALKAKRIEIADATEMWMVAQSNYGETLDDIKEQIRNPDMYLDPDRFHHLLSHLFRVNIFVFQRPLQAKDATLMTPRFKWVYYAPYKRFRKTIIIYEHYGARDEVECSANPVRYPRCEIVGVRIDGQIYFKFRDSDDVSTNLFAMATDSIHFNRRCERLPQNPVTLLDGEVTEQYIDQFGKTRGIVTNTDGTDLAFITPPLPIYPSVPSITYAELMSKMRNVPYIKYRDFIAMKEGQVLRQSLHIRDIFPDHVELECQISGTTLTFMCKSESEVANVTVLERPFIAYPRSLVDTIAKVSRAARHYKNLVEWVLGRTYVGGIPRNSEVISEWADSIIKIKKDMNLTITSTVLDKTDQFWNGEYIFVPDEGTKARLMYYILVTARRKPGHVKEEAEKVFSRGLFDYASDYKNVPSTMIFDSSKNFFRERNDLQVYNRVIHSAQSFFMQNILVNRGNPCLLLRSASMKHALASSSLFIRKRIIDDEPDTSFVPDKYIVYYYNSPNKIETLSVNDGTLNDACILQYKHNNKVYTLAVLSCLC
jgi:hypothetical protein